MSWGCPEAAAIDAQIAALPPERSDVLRYWYTSDDAPLNGSDTLNVDARLHGIELYFNCAAENDL